MRAVLRFLISALLGLGFFALPVPVNGQWTVVFDVVVKALRSAAPEAVGLYALALIIGGAVATLMASRRPEWLSGFQAGPGMTALRVAGVPLAILFCFELGPAALQTKAVGGLMWGVLIASVAVIIPLGAAVLNVLVGFGCLEFVGTLMRPLMRPLFRLPGRAALDDLTSWLGSYSVGLYLTRKLVDQGRYTRREAFIIATCFSTVSVGFVGVVASTLGLLSIFPMLFLAYFVVVYLVAIVQVRVWPTTVIPDTTVVPADPEEEARGAAWTRAWATALEQARDAPPMHRVAARGFVEGLVLAATILGTILSVGTLALVVAEYTPLFDWMGRPIVPVLTLLGLPDPELLAPATVAGITEMYIPALLVKEAAVEGRFFVALLSISQLIFFSSVGPMMMDMFRDVPIRFGHLVAVFALRTALLVPLVAAVTHLYGALGVFAGL